MGLPRRAGEALARGLPAQGRPLRDLFRSRTAHLSFRLSESAAGRRQFGGYALKHTLAGGLVALRAEPHFWERRVAEAAPVQERRRARLLRHNCVQVSVSDTGPGIAAEHHQEIFDDFVRVDPNTSGMGLGLAIAKRLVQAHRGKIWVESEPQRGSTFKFLMPIEPS